MDNPDDILEYLLSIGALEEAGFTANGDPLFRITEIADEFIPEFTQVFYEEFNNNVFVLWQKGFLDVVFDEEGEPMVSPMEKAYEENEWEQLDLEELFVLKQIVSVFEDQWYNDEEGDD